MDLLFVPACFIYLFAPLLVLVAGGIQIRTFGQSIVGWIVMVLALLWAIFFCINPYHITWVPNVLKGNMQETYLVVRALGVLVYTSVAMNSILRRSPGMRWVSVGVLNLIFADLIWSFLGGRYVGP